MTDEYDEQTQHATWLVGASLSGRDQTPRFLNEGIWELPHPSTQVQARIRSMRAGDRIALKSTSVQKYDLPFENRDHGVSTMRIKARGRIARVTDQLVEVDWEPLDPPRDWYFYTNLMVVWKLGSGEYAQRLDRFIFDDEPQDIGSFLDDPFWARYQTQNDITSAPDHDTFTWIPFYTAFAEALLDWQGHRTELTTLISDVRQEHGLSPWTDKTTDGSITPLTDVDPVTAMGIFNLGPTPAPKRQSIAQSFADRLGLDAEAPGTFDGIPTTHPQRAWLFPWAKTRGNAIDLVWDAFAAALAWADAPEDGARRKAFTEALPAALEATNWTLMTGLYRARPHWFAPLDGNTTRLLQERLGTPARPHHTEADATSWYLNMLDALHTHLRGGQTEVGSIPAFSLQAWTGTEDARPDSSDTTAQALSGLEDDDGTSEPEPYTLENLIADGCFVPREELEKMIEVLTRNLNLILQGAPGTGKTWLAKRLGWVLAGRKSPEHTQVVQFHPNTAYEDFIRGYRPKADSTGRAQLTLVDGPFLRLSDAAHESQDERFTMVIEEINRGNPARAFGEMLTLLEASKRVPDDAIHLTYETPGLEESGVWLPRNLHTIGTMNIADRSLAMVDLALRRRFAFRTLQPMFNHLWQDWVDQRLGDRVTSQAMKAGILELNSTITADPALGTNFVIGHSFLTPVGSVNDPRGWFHDQVEWSIRPVLHEYWFDQTERADEAANALLRALP